MAIILFDPLHRGKLYPLSNTKAIADLRIGILTTRERWQKITGNDVFVFTEKYLQPLYELPLEGNHLWIDASVVINESVAARILSLPNETTLIDDNGLVVASKADNGIHTGFSPATSFFENKIVIKNVERLEYPWQIFQWNDAFLRNDFNLITQGKNSQKLSETNKIAGIENVFVEEGASVEFAVINATMGPVYIGKNATVMEGVVIRGPLALCEGAVLKLGAKIYGATTLGPYCAGGGEIKNSVMQGYSNKAHDGYLGDSVIGSWCNLGAGTTNSNLKNTAGDIYLPDATDNKKINAGNKCGVIMGDYTRTAINSAINTGSVYGTCANVFGEGLLLKEIDSFTWGNKKDSLYQLDKALEDADRWKKLKKHALSEEEASVLKHLFDTFSQTFVR